jgi:hypothetical protein
MYLQSQQILDFTPLSRRLSLLYILLLNVTTTTTVAAIYLHI